MDWYGHEDDEEALQRGFQGEGGAGGDPGRPDAGELAAKHGVHHTMIAAWKRQAIEGMANTFSGAGDAAKAVSESELEKLHAKIGQLVVKRDFFSESPRSMSVDRRRAMVEPTHHHLSISAQCRLLRINRSSYYYASVPETDERLALMIVIGRDVHGVPMVR